MNLIELLEALDSDYKNYTTFSACLGEYRKYFNQGELSALSKALKQSMPDKIDNVYTSVEAFMVDVALNAYKNYTFRYFYVRKNLRKLMVYTVIKYHPEVNKYGKLLHTRAMFNKHSKKSTNKLKVHADTFMQLAKYALVRARIHNDKEAKDIVDKLFWFSKGCAANA